MFFQYYICKFPLFSTKYTTVFVCRDWYQYHHPFIIPLKMILIIWLKVHNTEQDFLMFKYMINIIWYGSFRIISRINPRPISSLELKLSGWYWCLGLIQDVIRKESYNILYLRVYIKMVWNLHVCVLFMGWLSVWWCLMPLSTIFQLYCGGQIRTQNISGDSHWLHR